MYRRRPTLIEKLVASDSLFWGMGAAFVIALLTAAGLTFLIVRQTIAEGQISRLQVPAFGQNPTPVAPPIPQNQPLQTGNSPAPAAWDGNTRINVLFMGLDYSDWRAGDGPARSDTLILFTFDPQTQTAGILSIPRDLWVQIPGFSAGKINTAYQLGEAYQTTGGGAALAMQTVENLLNIEINHYARVDFGTFVRLIDELGGVKINVPETIRIDLPGDGEKTQKKLEPGIQTLPGDWTLAYARARNTAGSDFDRAARQQQVILAIRDRLLNLNALPDLIARAPAIYQDVADGIHTNLTFEQIIRLAWAASSVPEGGIHRAVIGPDQTEFATSYDGQDILIPNLEAIRSVRDQVFLQQTLTIEPIAAAQPQLSAPERIAQEAATISLQNGTFTPGLAGRTRDYLAQNDLAPAQVSNADQTYANTTIIDYTGNPYTVAKLVELLNIAQNRIFSRYDPQSAFDIVIILGADWANNNPMP